MIRRESRSRARALQMLYAIELAPATSPQQAFLGLCGLVGYAVGVTDQARSRVDAVLAHRADLDRLTQQAADNWRFERLGMVERNILRLGVEELVVGVTPAKVVIDESIWLAHRFAGPRAPAFVNGVLDRVARALGRL